MKCRHKILAIVLVAALVIGAIPVAMALTSVNSKKSLEKPVPVALKKGSYFDGVAYLEDYSSVDLNLYPMTTLQSQRLQLPYGSSFSGFWTFPPHFEYSISPATKTAYGLTDATIEKYLRYFSYEYSTFLEYSYDNSDYLLYWEFMDLQPQPLKEISLVFSNAFTLYPKENSGWAENYREHPLKIRIDGNPTFGFYYTTGPVICDTAYSPEDEILYDAAFRKGSAENDLQINFRAEEKAIWDFDDETEEDILIGYEDRFDLYEEAPQHAIIHGVDNDYYADDIEFASSEEGDTNDEISFTLSSEFINSLEVGLYYIDFPFTKGTSRFILQINEASCNGIDCDASIFSDLNPDEWYHEAADFVIEKNYMNGTANNRFSPATPCTRAQFVRLLWNMEGMPLPIGTTSQFSDVEADSWYEDAVIWAAENQIVGGTSPSTFSPNMIMTREQAATMLHNYVKSRGQRIPYTDHDILMNFTDGADVSSWATDGMIWACSAGFINGKGNALLDPQGQLSRIEMAQLIYNYFNK